MRTSLPVLVLLCLGIARPVHAQTPPSTDIYLVTLSEDGVSAPAPVTNRDGYDNQPHFTADGSSILYTSRWGDQTEIYRYNLAQKMSAKVTDTPESEYSQHPYRTDPAFPSSGSKRMAHSGFGSLITMAEILRSYSRELPLWATTPG